MGSHAFADEPMRPNRALGCATLLLAAILFFSLGYIAAGFVKG